MRVKIFCMGYCNNTTLKDRLLRTNHLPMICFYCGEPASDKEHVLPKSIFGERTHKVWSCRECNLLAGAKVFQDIYEKQLYIKSRLERRYKKILRMPKWEEYELEELGETLRASVKSSIEARKWIEKRLSWHKSLVVLVAVKYLENKDIGKDFVQQAADKSGMRLSELRSILEL